MGQCYGVPSVAGTQEGNVSLRTDHPFPPRDTLTAVTVRDGPYCCYAGFCSAAWDGWRMLR